MCNCLFERENLESFAQRIAEILRASIFNNNELKEELPKNMDLNKYLNINELADYFGVTRQTIYNWRKDSYFSSIIRKSSHKAHNKTLFDPIGLEEAISTNRYLSKKHISIFHYNDSIFENEREVKKWVARIAIKEEFGYDLTDQETKFKEAFKTKTDNKMQKPDIYGVK